MGPLLENWVEILLKLEQAMNDAKPIFDPATHYRIDVRGQVDAEWLQSFDSSAEINVCDTSPTEDLIVLDVHTDQSGVVGLVRRLHGLGIAILKLEIVKQGQ